MTDTKQDICKADTIGVIWMSDLISRQAAIDALCKMLHDCFWADDEELDAVITTLNELPSAQPETCEDTVSRKGVAEAVEYYKKSVHHILGDCEFERVADAIHGLIRALPTVTPKPDLTEEEWKLIKKLRSFHNGSYAKLLDKLIASAPPEQRWIPCSERLPEEPFGCLVTVWDTNPVTMDEFENILPYFVGWDGEQWNDADGEQCPFEVIAWCELPEPYREEGEG